jgi:hypothetical protein
MRLPAAPSRWQQKLASSALLTAPCIKLAAAQAVVPCPLPTQRAAYLQLQRVCKVERGGRHTDAHGVWVGERLGGHPREPQSAGGLAELPLRVPKLLA